MKYNGIELTEFTSDTPVIFDPPKRMAVWDGEKSRDGSKGRVHVTSVLAFLPNRRIRVIGSNCVYRHCAEIAEEQNMFEEAE